MTPKRHTHIVLDEIFARAIQDIRLTQVGGPKEMVISINYHKYIYEIEALIKEEVDKALEKERSRKSFFKKKRSN